MFALWGEYGRERGGWGGGVSASQSVCVSEGEWGGGGMGGWGWGGGEGRYRFSLWLEKPYLQKHRKKELLAERLASMFS